MATNKSDKKSGVTSDPRFSTVHSDPRFKVPRKKHQKGQLDDRFKDAFKDERFQRRAKTDKYGRKVDSTKELDEAKKYAGYEDSESESEEEENIASNVDVSEDEDEQVEAKSDEESESEVVSSSDDEDSNVVDRARGEGISDSESSSDEDSSDEDEIEVQEEELLVQPEEHIPSGEETDTFAVVNLDWDNVRAVDLMATFSSFAPPRGRVLWVKILPSEYGKEQMAKEAKSGPSAEFFETSKRGKSTKKEEITVKDIVEEGDADEDYNSSVLRKYQLQRLRYYYAVVKCDSVHTSSAIYTNCDGTEFETTANFFDLRYVPAGMDFDDEPKDTCDKVPADFKPNVFVTDALQHSKVKLTWDETPAERRKVTHKKYSQKELEEMDLQAYIASESESEDEEIKEQRLEILRSAAGGLLSSKNSEPEVDGEVEFTFGGTSDGDKDQSDTEETTLEKYKRKQKERKEKRKAAAKEAKSADSGVSSKKKDRAEAARKEEELKLLAIDDEFDASKAEEALKKVQNEGKSKRKSKKKQREAELAAMEKEVPTTDDRFSRLFDSPEFAIDTTSSQFKKTKGLQKIMEERRKRQSEVADEGPVGKKSKKRKTKEADEPVNVGMLVNKLKARHARHAAVQPEES